MEPQPLDLEAVTQLAAEQGINNVSELARRCEGVERSYLSRVLRGERPAYPRLVATLAKALGVERSRILRDEQAVS